MKFAVLIISHGRPDCTTPDILRKSGYTGDIYVICDDEDKTLPEYEKRFGDHLLVFHKEQDFDLGDNFDGPKGVGVFARRACVKFAKELGIDCFYESDDDMKGIVYRYEDGEHLKSKKVHNLDAVFNAISEYIMSVPVMGVGLGNPFDYLGGLSSQYVPLYSRRLPMMCGFFQRTDNPVEYKSRMCDDWISSTLAMRAGGVITNFYGVETVYDLLQGKSLDQTIQEESNKKTRKGGQQEAYAGTGVYVMDYYIFMFCSFAVERIFDGMNMKVKYNKRNAVPMLLSESVRK